MTPNNPTAVSQRFASVVARGIKRADQDLDACLAVLRAIPHVDEPRDDEEDAWEAPSQVAEHRRPMKTTPRRRETASKETAVPLRARGRRRGQRV
jgi:hypothetical protein